LWLLHLQAFGSLNLLFNTTSADRKKTRISENVSHQKQKKHEQENLHWYLVETISCFLNLFLNLNRCQSRNSYGGAEEEGWRSETTRKRRIGVSQRPSRESLQCRQLLMIASQDFFRSWSSWISMPKAGAVGVAAITKVQSLEPANSCKRRRWRRILSLKQAMAQSRAM
jgi:hypothetical protein